MNVKASGPGADPDVSVSAPTFPANENLSSLNAVPSSPRLTMSI